MSRINGAFVIARNTAFTFEGKAVEVKRLGRVSRADRKWPRLDQIDAFDPEQAFAVARRSRIMRRACPMLFAAYRSMQGLAAASTAMLYQLSAKR